MNLTPFPTQAFTPRPKQRSQLFAILSLGALMMCVTTVFIIFFAVRRVHLVGTSNYTLEEGTSVPGTLLLLSQNATLEQNSSVGGSVIMLCCNLTMDGKVNGNVFLLTGNLWLDTHAEVDGDVNVVNGNLRR